MKWQNQEPITARKVEGGGSLFGFEDIGTTNPSELLAVDRRDREGSSIVLRACEFIEIKPLIGKVPFIANASFPWLRAIHENEVTKM